MRLYLDASALVKRYVAEVGSEVVRAAMESAAGWYTCRAGFLETVRAVGLVAGTRKVRAVTDEWPAFGVVEIDQQLVEDAAALALDHGLRSLDALHLAAALLLRGDDLIFASSDGRQRTAAVAEGLAVLPETLE